MAVTLTAAVLRDALKLADDDDGNATAARLLAVATAAVNGYAPGAPESVSNEAALRTAGYLDADDPGFKTLRKMAVGKVDLEPRAAGSALRLSGAQAFLAPYRTRRAGGLAS